MLVLPDLHEKKTKNPQRNKKDKPIHECKRRRRHTHTEIERERQSRVGGTWRFWPLM
jgi:hypothetical protein